MVSVSLCWQSACVYVCLPGCVCVHEYLCARVLRHERYPAQTPSKDIGFSCGGETSL